MFSWFFNRLDKFRQKLRPHIPFTMLNTILKNLDKTSRSILDVGCGKGQPMKYINRHKKYFTVGVDIFEPYINLCKEQQIHNEYILGDVRNLEFKNQSYDVVLCTEVLEHLTQAEISELECRDAELKLFEKSPDIKLLDVGCAEGDFTLRVANAIGTKKCMVSKLAKIVIIKHKLKI